MFVIASLLPGSPALFQGLMPLLIIDIRPFDVEGQPRSTTLIV